MDQIFQTKIFTEIKKYFSLRHWWSQWNFKIKSVGISSCSCTHNNSRKNKLF